MNYGKPQIELELGTRFNGEERYFFAKAYGDKALLLAGKRDNYTVESQYGFNHLSEVIYHKLGKMNGVTRVRLKSAKDKMNIKGAGINQIGFVCQRLNQNGLVADVEKAIEELKRR